MADDDGDELLTADEMISAAEGLIQKLQNGWGENGFPPALLANAMVGAGLARLTHESGVEATLQLLRDLMDEIEQAGREAPSES